MKSYWPTILVGAATIGSITAGTILSKKAEASLSAAVIMLERGYNKYQGKVKSIFGKSAHENILKEIADDETKKLNLPTSIKNTNQVLFYNTYIGHFYATKEDLTRAILNMNMRLNSAYSNKIVSDSEKGVCTLKQFVEEANAHILDKEAYEAYKILVGLINI